MFADRSDAGRQLAAQLEHLREEQLTVLGLPRGGVPVAFEVARALGAPLDVIVVRKLGVPFHHACLRHCRRRNDAQLCEGDGSAG